MGLQYKIDVLNALKEKGFNTNKIRTEGLLSQSTLQKFREKKGVSWEILKPSAPCWSVSPAIYWNTSKNRSVPPCLEIPTCPLPLSWKKF